MSRLDEWRKFAHQSGVAIVPDEAGQPKAIILPWSHYKRLRTHQEEAEDALEGA